MRSPQPSRARRHRKPIGSCMTACRSGCSGVRPSSSNRPRYVCGCTLRTSCPWHSKPGRTPTARRTSGRRSLLPRRQSRSGQESRCPRLAPRSPPRAWSPDPSHLMIRRMLRSIPQRARVPDRKRTGAPRGPEEARSVCRAVLSSGGATVSCEPLGTGFCTFVVRQGAAPWCRGVGACRGDIAERDR
jgi:hypothetical protein